MGLKPIVTLTLPGGVPMHFRRIEPDSFTMGARGEWDREEPRHRVEIARPFWLGETPVTQAQFAAWTRAEGVKHENRFENKPDHPAENMDWFEATRFCRWLTEACSLQTPSPEMPEGGWACLPTEAEWEYACRAGTDTEYYSGDGDAALTEAGWFGEEWDSGSTHPVRGKKENAFGLHDMHGNVWEWCHDVFVERAYCVRVEGIRDPGWDVRIADYRAERGFERSENDPLRVLRGGSWYDTARFCRSAIRIGNVPVIRIGSFGFRVCLVPGPFKTDTASRAQPAPGDGGRGTSPESEGASGATIDLAKEKTPPA